MAIIIFYDIYLFLVLCLDFHFRIKLFPQEEQLVNRELQLISIPSINTVTSLISDWLVTFVSAAVICFSFRLIAFSRFLNWNLKQRSWFLKKDDFLIWFFFKQTDSIIITFSSISLSSFSICRDFSLTAVVNEPSWFLSKVKTKVYSPPQKKCFGCVNFLLTSNSDSHFPACEFRLSVSELFPQPPYCTWRFVTIMIWIQNISIIKSFFFFFANLILSLSGFCIHRSTLYQLLKTGRLRLQLIKVE